LAVVQLDVTIVNTTLSSIGATLGGGVSELQWVVSAFTIAFAALILTAGALGDRLGARIVFMWGFGVFTAASLACALAPNSLALISARTVQGVGPALLIPNSLALINHACPDENERGRAGNELRQCGVFTLLDAFIGNLVRNKTASRL
jgi:DHA2 family methylenomycin A resistance protein-like MFS transporter